MKMKVNVWTALVLSLFMAGAVCASAPSAHAQQAGRKPAGQPSAQTKPSDAAKEGAKGTSAFTLRASKDAPHTYTLKAKNAKVSDIAQELSRSLGAPIRLSPLMSKQTISIELEGVNLEGVLRMLAPHPFVDYVASGSDPQPKVLAVYLNALNEQAPALNETIKNSVDTLLIEGDTEEGTEEYERKRKERAEPLRVSFQNNRLSVHAEKQPLSIVLYKVASELGIPFELGSDSTEVIDADFTDYPVDQAMRTLSPSVRLFYRADLLNFENLPIRIALTSNANAPAAAND
ncbi:MAG TPA: hypothetical protein VFX96_19690 [Pyrinomonadaceae bacterium]|nr:hypothetical protein [Pyrinomonadaceae bacterium]